MNTDEWNSLNSSEDDRLGPARACIFYPFALGWIFGGLAVLAWWLDR